MSTLRLAAVCPTNNSWMWRFREALQKLGGVDLNRGTADGAPKVLLTGLTLARQLKLWLMLPNQNKKKNPLKHEPHKIHETGSLECTSSSNMKWHLAIRSSYLVSELLNSYVEAWRAQPTANTVTRDDSTPSYSLFSRLKCTTRTVALAVRNAK